MGRGFFGMTKFVCRRRVRTLSRSCGKVLSFAALDFFSFSLIFISIDIWNSFSKFFSTSRLRRLATSGPFSFDRTSRRDLAVARQQGVKPCLRNNDPLPDLDGRDFPRRDTVVVASQT